MNRQQRRAAMKHGAGTTVDTQRNVMGMFAEANRLHRAGRVAEAEKLYRAVLALDPRHFGSLNLLGVIAIEAGRLDAAIQLLRKGIAIDATVSQSHFHLGVALQNSGRAAEAATSYRRAASLKPDYFEALNNLGLALSEAGQPDDAVEAYLKAIAVNPRVAGVYYNLGMARQAQGSLDEALACYRRALAIDPRFADAYNNLGIVLKEQGRADEAAAAYRELLKLKPDYPAVRSNLGNALREQGQFEEAISVYEQATSIEGEAALAFHGLSVCRKFNSADCPLVARMEAALGRAGLSDLDKSLLHFALGKAYDDLSDYRSAMTHFDFGNEIENKSRRYDPRETVRIVDRLIECAPRGTSEAAAASESDLPIFIVGMPRSGTTLVEQILASHRDIAGAGELGFWPRKLDRLRTGMARGLAPAEAARAVRDYLVELRARSPNALRVTDKMPFNFLFVGLLHALFPRARIIHCRRRAIDTALSIYFTRFVGPHEFAYSREAIVHFHGQYERLMAHWRAVVPSENLMELNYDELVADQESMSRRMVDFCGLEWDEACLAFHKTNRSIVTASAWQARQPVYRSSAARWRNYEPWLGGFSVLLPDIPNEG